VVKAIVADVDAHAQNQTQGDDMTIVAMTIDQRRAKRKTTTLPGVSPADVGATPRLQTEGGTPDDAEDDDDA
jgi:hypothetical protein